MTLLRPRKGGLLMEGAECFVVFAVLVQPDPARGDIGRQINPVFESFDPKGRQEEKQRVNPLNIDVYFSTFLCYLYQHEYVLTMNTDLSPHKTDKMAWLVQEASL